MTDETQPGIPGLDLTSSDPNGATRPALEQGVRDTLGHLHTLGYLQPRHAVHVSLAVALAQSINTKLRSGRTSTLAHDARELRDLLDSLIPEEAKSDTDKMLEKAMADWQAQIERMS